ncbi:hypothetical protein BV22DRAFT_1023015 [Leucogyrophana mollusca]|uniref:Uncharacterized protein n=1 Tax=Leucogyrophana mollusca TaxID=85980 RepID=A0ACB8B2J7_9AGAM|nr:hypothetical protein BV22DRAFT_1023015 [Leucogyrophana mollusca]
MLNGTAVALQSACAHADGLEIDGLDDMARKLPTVKKRLGVALDSLITYYFICPSCWNLHHQATLCERTLSDECVTEDCKGILYTTKQMADGQKKRVPTKVLPFVHPKCAIQHWLLRPGKYADLQCWQGAGNEPGRRPPLDTEGFGAFANPNAHAQDTSAVCLPSMWACLANQS